MTMCARSGNLVQQHADLNEKSQQAMFNRQKTRVEKLGATTSQQPDDDMMLSSWEGDGMMQQPSLRFDSF